MQPVLQGQDSGVQQCDGLLHEGALAGDAFELGGLLGEGLAEHGRQGLLFGPGGVKTII